MNRPLMLGIVGDHASGKTTLARGIVRRLGRNGVTPICLDDYHRYSRAERAMRGVTALDPQANDMALMAEHVATLHRGGTIHKPIYDHRTGTLREPELVAATGLVVAYGLLTLTPPVPHDLFDLTIYLDPAPSLQQTWCMERDVSQRGYTPNEVMQQQPARDDDARRFVQVQRPLADMIIRFAPAAAQNSLDLQVLVRHRLRRIELDLPPDSAMELVHNWVDEDGLPTDMLSVPATTSPTALGALSAQLQSRSRSRCPELITPQPRSGDYGPSMALVHDLAVAYLLEQSTA